MVDINIVNRAKEEIPGSLKNDLGTKKPRAPPSADPVAALPSSFCYGSAKAPNTGTKDIHAADPSFHCAMHHHGRFDTTQTTRAKEHSNRTCRSGSTSAPHKPHYVLSDGRLRAKFSNTGTTPNRPSTLAIIPSEEPADPTTSTKNSCTPRPRTGLSETRT
ncbi:hypothetical protein Salat_0897800 [Sesamum alatum]|uniref:Uncharacterized protein n=1 Tax=Sesamum alatum TaxID=300844 RepID=A0AAE2CR31_9LAMI|nr:hypothetical protein Salat_0897800 [Sesamum alatum]